MAEETISVINNLTSNSSTDALSARQGKVLKGLIDDLAASIEIATEAEIDALFAEETT